MMPAIFNRKTISKILNKITVSNKCLFILHQQKKLYIKPLPTSLYGEKTNAKTTRSSNQRQHTIELPDERMVDDMDPSTKMQNWLI